MESRRIERRALPKSYSPAHVTHQCSGGPPNWVRCTRLATRGFLTCTLHRHQEQTFRDANNLTLERALASDGAHAAS